MLPQKISNSGIPSHLQYGINKNIVQNMPKNDIYKDSSLRFLGFTNEVGAALAPIIGPVGELVSYIPALSYIFMDIRDKYKRGDDDTYQKASKKRAFEESAFQTFASVILPTAAVKTAQAIGNKIIDSKFFKPCKDAIANWVSNKKSLYKFVQKFADKSHSNIPKDALNKFAVGFQKALDRVTVFPLFFKQTSNKSGLRNLGLAAIGLTALAFVIKPIDYFTEHIIIEKIVKPILGKP